jgi:hypothetical protein
MCFVCVVLCCGWAVTMTLWWEWKKDKSWMVDIERLKEQKNKNGAGLVGARFHKTSMVSVCPALPGGKAQ